MTPITFTPEQQAAVNKVASLRLIRTMRLATLSTLAAAEASASAVPHANPAASNSLQEPTPCPLS